MDFKALDWKKQPVDGEVAKFLRKDVRFRRRERGRSGHRFRFATLKSLWIADEIYVVLNHADDASWQYWYYDHRDGWNLIGWYLTRREAQAAAEMPRPKTPPKFLGAGLYVIAGWPCEDAEVNYTMKVACQSEETADEIMSVFNHLGCVTMKTQLAA